MAKKERRPPSKPNMGYLVSFGDTMTALLAFFIVLNSLAKEQTGANLHAGTSSFSSAFKDLATPGSMSTDRTKQAITQDYPSPIYALKNDKLKSTDAHQGIGPDEKDDNGRVIDRDQDNFKRFLNELNHQFQLNEQPATKSQIVFDSFERLLTGESPLDENGVKLAAKAIPMLRSSNYRVEIIVWSRTPSEFAMNEAFNHTVLIKNQLSKSFFLTPMQEEQIRFSAKPWLFADAKRPIVSFVVSRTQ
jgi:hypothetical protein